MMVLREMGYEAAQFIMTMILLNTTVLYSLCFVHAEYDDRPTRFAVYAVIMIISLVVSWLLTKIAAAAGLATLVFLMALLTAYAYFVYRSMMFLQGNINKTFAVLLYIYAGAVLYVTVLSRIGLEKQYWVKTSLWESIKRFTTVEAGEELRHFGLNILMFLPIGTLLVLSNKAVYGRWKYFVVGVLFSACIEATQLFFNVGECDVADIAGNGMGTLIGIGLGYLAALVFKL